MPVLLACAIEDSTWLCQTFGMWWGGFELWNQICHCKTVSIKRNLYL